jgi:uncharacterized protein (DUF885 family)
MMQISRRALLGAGAASVAVLSGCATGAAPAAATAPPTASAQLTATLDRTVAAILRESPERCTALGLTEERAGYRFVDKLSDASKASTARYRGILQNRAPRTCAPSIAAALPAQEQRHRRRRCRTSYENSLANSAFECRRRRGRALCRHAADRLATATCRTSWIRSIRCARAMRPTPTWRASANTCACSIKKRRSSARTPAGVIPPDFAIDRALEQMTSFTSTSPAQTVLVQTLVRRLPAVAEISEGERASISRLAESAVRDAILPAYERQKAALARSAPQRRA